MNLNPMKWFRKEQEAFAWVELTPAHPFAGLARFSGAPERPYEYAVRLTGLTPEEAAATLCGRVVDFPMLEAKEMKAARQGALVLDIEGMRKILK